MTAMKMSNTIWHEISTYHSEKLSFGGSKGNKGCDEFMCELEPGAESLAAFFRPCFGLRRFWRREMILLLIHWKGLFMI